MKQQKQETKKVEKEKDLVCQVCGRPANGLFNGKLLCWEHERLMKESMGQISLYALLTGRK